MPLMKCTEDVSAESGTYKAGASSLAREEARIEFRHSIAPAAAVTATAAATFGLGARFIDRESPAVNLLAV